MMIIRSEWLPEWDIGSLDMMGLGGWRRPGNYSVVVATAVVVAPAEISKANKKNVLKYVYILCTHRPKL